MSEKTQLVLVECVSMFRMRYLVGVPVGTDNYGYNKKEAMKKHKDAYEKGE